MAVRLHLFSNFGAHLGELDSWDVEHSAAINGSDELRFCTGRPLALRDRVVWREAGEWHEAVMASSEQSHDGAQECSHVFRASYQGDMRLAPVNGIALKGVKAAYALGEILKLCPQWEVGEVDGDGTADLELSKSTAYKALLEIASKWGLEIEPSIEVEGGAVSARKINLRQKRGEDRGARFDYAWNMDGVAKRINDEDVYTAVYGFGKDDMTFASINNGKPYVTWDGESMQAALSMWGVPDGSGGLLHSFGVYENSECSNARQLFDEAADYLAAHSSPSVTYETDVAFDALRGVRLGDAVHVVDTEFEPPLRLEARVASLTRELDGGGTASCTFGTVTSVLPDVLTRTLQQAQSAMQTALAAAAKAGSMASNVVTDKVTIGGNSGGTLTTGADGELIYTDPDGGIHTLAVPGTGEVIEGGGGQ